MQYAVQVHVTWNLYKCSIFILLFCVVGLYTEFLLRMLILCGDQSVFYFCLFAANFAIGVPLLVIIAVAVACAVLIVVLLSVLLFFCMRKRRPRRKELDSATARYVDL